MNELAHLKAKIYLGDCVRIMQQIPSDVIDLTVTSPPYDDLRTYAGTLEWGEHVWRPVLENLYRITKPGGVVVWVVGDATIKGDETGTSFKQALYAKECGFNLHDTMIYIKNQLAFPDVTRYYGAFEYMFVFSKGRPRTFNPIKDRKNQSAGRGVNGCERTKNGGLRKRRAGAGNVIPEYGVRWNYWLMYNQSRGENTKHPASFPDALANDHIISWSNPGDVVFDPFMGSGTTGKMAIKNGRSFVGVEKVSEYFDIAKKRILEGK